MEKQVTHREPQRGTATHDGNLVGAQTCCAFAFDRKTRAQRVCAPSAASYAMNPVSESLNPPEDRKPVAAGGNCVAAMRGGEQPEAEVRPQTGLPRPVNSIRCAAGASPLGKDEACRCDDEPRTARGLSMLDRGRAVYGWSGDVRKGAWRKMRRRCRGTDARAGIRALRVAVKPGNAGGAKERRKVNAR